MLRGTREVKNRVDCNSGGLGGVGITGGMNGGGSTRGGDGTLGTTGSNGTTSLGRDEDG